MSEHKSYRIFSGVMSIIFSIGAYLTILDIIKPDMRALSFVICITAAIAYGTIAGWTK